MNRLHNRSEEFSRLKTLLFSEEHEALTGIANLVRKHDLRVGDDRALQHSVAEILAEALREAEIKNHRELAAAIAPLIVAAIKREIRNSSDEVVDALYPIMGRLIRAYVASAIRDFIEQTNRQIESGISARFIRLRVKSLVTGIPYRTLMIREGTDLRVSGIYLINRSSGALLESWTSDLAPHDDRHDLHLIGGMLAAINNFAAEFLPEHESELRMLDLSDCRVYLRASVGYLVAMKTVGKGSRRLKRLLDTEMQHALERLAPLPPDAVARHRETLAELADSVTALAEKEKQPPVLALSVIAGLVILAGLIGYQEHSRSQAAARLRASVLGVIEAQAPLRGFPLTVDVAKDRRTVTVSGLVPSDADREKLIAAAAAEIRPAKLDPQLIVSPSMSGYLALAKSIEDLKGLIDQRDRDAARRTAEQFQTMQMQLSALDFQLTERSAKIETQLTALQTAVNDPLLKLSQWVAMHAIFFSDDDTFRDEALAIRTLTELRDILNLSNARVRIIGYTDPSGTDARNDTLAATRAEKVAKALEQLGIPRSRMKILGRPRGLLLSYDKGPLSSNRRVEFELALEGEPMEQTGVPLSETGLRP
jgi:outer membrane protein OmpA-like peptidoglycan-associated protein